VSGGGDSCALRGFPRLFASCPAVPLCCLFVGAALIRWACFHFGFDVQAPDEADYVGIARNLAARGAFEAPAECFWPAYFRAPLLPYALAAFFKLGVGIDGTRLVLCLINALFPLFALGLARELGAPPSARGAAGLLAAFHPLHVRLSEVLMTDALAATLMAAVFWAAAREARRGPSVSSRAALGLSLGAMVCLRTNLGLFAVGFSVAWMFDRRFAPRRRLLLVGAAALAAFAVAVPAAVLRSVQENRMLLITDGGSELFWRGNSSFASEYLDGNTGAYLDAYRAAAGGAPRAPEGAVRARAAAWDYISARPRAWLTSKARMLFATWRPLPTFDSPATRGGGDGGAAGRIAKLLWFALLDGCWFVVFLGRRRLAGRPEALPLVAALVVATAFGAAFVPDHRYRMPADTALLALAAAAVPQSPTAFMNVAGRLGSVLSKRVGSGRAGVLVSIERWPFRALWAQAADTVSTHAAQFPAGRAAAIAERVP